MKTLFGLVATAVLCSAGCGKPVGYGAPEAATPATVPAESAKVQAFREKVAHYLDEARVGAKLLTVAPSLAEASAKAKHITDLYTRLPDVPPEIDTTGKVAEWLKNINGAFAAAELNVQLSDDLVRLKSADGVKKARENLLHTAEDVNQLINDIAARCLKQE